LSLEAFLTAPWVSYATTRMTPAVDNQNVAWMCAVLLFYFDDYSSLAAVGRIPRCATGVANRRVWASSLTA